MIRLLTAKDAADWRGFRLHMLLAEPLAFCATYADVASRPLEFFADWPASHRVFVEEEMGQFVGAAVCQENSGTIAGHLARVDRPAFGGGTERCQRHRRATGT